MGCLWRRLKTRCQHWSLGIQKCSKHPSGFVIVSSVHSWLQSRLDAAVFWEAEQWRHTSSLTWRSSASKSWRAAVQKRLSRHIYHGKGINLRVCARDIPWRVVNDSLSSRIFSLTTERHFFWFIDIMHCLIDQMDVWLIDVCKIILWTEKGSLHKMNETNWNLADEVENGYKVNKSDLEFYMRDPLDG